MFRCRYRRYGRADVRQHSTTQTSHLQWGQVHTCTLLHLHPSFWWYWDLEIEIKLSSYLGLLSAIYNCLNFHIWWCSIYYCLLVDPHIFCKGFHIIWEIIGHEKAFLLISERLAKCSTLSEALRKLTGFLLISLPLITLFDRKMPIKEIHLDRILKEMELTQEQVCEYAITSHTFANNV